MQENNNVYSSNNVHGEKHGSVKDCSDCHIERHEHSHSHNHHVSGISAKKIFWVTILNAAITTAEIIGGILSGSLALLSDAAHNFSDTVAIALSYFANKLAQKPNDAKKTYGYARAEILSAFINASVLLAISAVLIFEAIKRIKSPETINGTLMIMVALIGLIANFVSVLLLEKDSHENLNIKSGYLHLLSDTVSSVGVLAGGIAIKLWGITWIDPLITSLISLYIIRETWHVIKKTVDILMQASADLDYEAIKRDVEKIDKVKNIHHVHSWMSNEKTIYFDAHIDLEDMKLLEAEGVCAAVERFLKEHYGISHVTLQAEVDKCCDKSIFKV